MPNTEELLYQTDESSYRRCSVKKAIVKHLAIFRICRLFIKPLRFLLNLGSYVYHNGHKKQTLVVLGLLVF